MSLKSLGCKAAIALLLQASFISADCECGYRVPSSGNPQEPTKYLLFTDSIQTDFRGMTSLNDSSDWKIKDLRLEYVPNKSRFGRIVEDRNVIFNPAVDPLVTPDGPSQQGADVDAGLQLIVRSELVEDNLVSTGQIQSIREDVRFGSFRAYMKSTPINGTCAASFWYHNDSQEIDIELLSRQREDGRQPINLSVQSNESVANDYDATGTTGFIEGQADFDPADGFHEYRYDWSPDVISFWADGGWLGDIVDFIPTTPGYFQLSHWSNGFAGWSAGPPSQDALIMVAYFRGYFNSTDPVRAQEFEERCGGGRSAGSVCDVSGFEQVTRPWSSILAKTDFEK
ncbi:hypothetical protein N0V87_006578 [Didymella glomerata]|jgi:hypothetical protein|uniref:GH16 domain-containing protein n=1 Tax=Didymella glomerata TaxID=749621 RepID=A0A9W8WWE1_9PLEO|nr:hypothetical protein N0V87_006578 [Didymella glomerata]